jgi:predicted nucleic acid-binding protein
MVDTSFFIDLRRQRDPGAIQIWTEITAGMRTASISPIVIYELWVGGRLNREEEAFYSACFSLIEEAPLLGGAAMVAGEWMRRFPDRSESLIRDALIAASALGRGEPVLTRNVRDFTLFPDVRVETY